MVKSAETCHSGVTANPAFFMVFLNPAWRVPGSGSPARTPGRPIFRLRLKTGFDELETA
jgi:hypothetical protein